MFSFFVHCKLNVFWRSLATLSLYIKREKYIKWTLCIEFSTHLPYKSQLGCLDWKKYMKIQTIGWSNRWTDRHRSWHSHLDYGLTYSNRYNSIWPIDHLFSHSRPFGFHQIHTVFEKKLVGKGAPCLLATPFLFGCDKSHQFRRLSNFQQGGPCQAQVQSSPYQAGMWYVPHCLD